ncbi:hypothetical protein [Nonlabens agnitus]|nr:hypothetical protein [Nonlabens agnitus]
MKPLSILFLLTGFLVLGQQPAENTSNPSSFIEGEENHISYYQEFMPDQIKNIGFRYPLASFDQQLIASGLPYNTNKNRDQFFVQASDKPYRGVMYTFLEGTGHELGQVTIYFYNEEAARAYYAEQFKGNFDEKSEWSFVKSIEGLPTRTMVWQFKERVFLAANLPGSNWSGSF